MRQQLASADAAVARIAARQHGVVSQRQLREAGLSPSAIARRVRSGRLHHVHRGVYAVGHPGISQRGEWRAAALAFGAGAVVSHRSAAELWGLLRPAGGPIDVSVPGGGGRARRGGLRVHRRASLPAASLTRRDGIPVTKPARTIADLRGCASPDEVRRAIRQADVLGLPIGADVEHDRTRSDLERDFLRLCRRYGLPRPQVNVWIGRRQIDFLWPDCRIAVETDGYTYHRGRQAFRDDRRRDLELRARGLEVVRLSEEQVDGEPERVAAILRRVLASAHHRVEADG